MYCDRTTIAVAGSSDRMVAAAVSPSTVRVGGILMSVITRSGRRDLVLSIRPSRSPAVPTTS